MSILPNLSITDWIAALTASVLVTSAVSARRSATLTADDLRCFLCDICNTVNRHDDRTFASVGSGCSLAIAPFPGGATGAKHDGNLVLQSISHDQSFKKPIESHGKAVTQHQPENSASMYPPIGRIPFSGSTFPIAQAV